MIRVSFPAWTTEIEKEMIEEENDQHNDPTEEDSENKSSVPQAFSAADSIDHHKREMDDLEEADEIEEQDTEDEPEELSEDELDLDAISQLEEEILEEEFSEEQIIEYVPPPLPEPPKSFGAKCWDTSPQFFQRWLRKWGVKPPLDASGESEIIRGMTSRGGMLLGPPSAGKTTLIAAMARSCRIPVRSNIDLRWRAAGDAQSIQELSELLDKSVAQILDKDLRDDEKNKATNRHVRYDFNIEGRLNLDDSFNSPQLFNMKLSFHDGPGGAMFTTDRAVWDDQEETRKSMLRDSKNAYTLIFCFDGSIRSGRLMHSSLFRILPLLQRQQRRRNYIEAMRVLILLNKVDQVCDKFYRQMLERNPELRKNRHFTPHSIAGDMDPMAMAVECLGYEAIKMIRDAMRPDAELAVGLTSTWGFKYDGRPLVDHKGQPTFNTQLDRGSENEFIAQWRPFGIRESLVYLATGETDSMIQVVTQKDLNSDFRHRHYSLKRGRK